jgi:hypothetical protein
MQQDPKEKAKELIDTYLDIENYNNLNLDLFSDECGINIQSAKYCALIAVSELIEESYYTIGYNQRYEYWLEVKKEIEKL